MNQLGYFSKGITETATTQETQAIERQRPLYSMLPKPLKTQRSTSPISPASSPTKRPKSSSCTVKSIKQISRPFSAPSPAPSSAPSLKKRSETIAKQQPSPLLKQRPTSTTPSPPPTTPVEPQSTVPNVDTEENDSKPRHRLVKDWFSHCDIDQESVHSNIMSEAMSVPQEMDMLSTHVYQSRLELVLSDRYQVFYLHRLGVHMLSPTDKSVKVPVWLRSPIQRCDFARTESVQTPAKVKELHNAIVEATIADDADTHDIVYDRVIAGLQLDNDERGGYIKICADLQFSLHSVIQNPQKDDPASMAVPKPALTIGYGNITFQNIAVPYNSNNQQTFTVNNRNSLWTPFLIVEMGKNSTEYVTITRLLGAASSSLNVNRRVITRMNTVFSLCLQSSTASLYATWCDSGNYITMLVKSFALMEYTQFLALRRYVDNIVNWASNERLQNIKEVFHNNQVPEPDTPIYKNIR